MEAPRWPGGTLIYERIRCVCSEENLLVYPDLWYPGQEAVDREPLCAACQRGLLPQLLPVGVVEEVYRFAEIPTGVVARLADPELEDELMRLESRSPRPDSDHVWDARHAAPDAYLEWLEAHPPTKPKSRWRPFLLLLVLVSLFAAALWASTL